MKTKISNLKPDDKILIWGGGIWNWFDPVTLIQAVYAISKKRSDIKLFFYSFRVAVAAGIALVFVFSSTLSFVANKRINPGNINSSNLSVVSTINTQITNFSTKIVNLEVFNNEKEKK